MHNEIHLIAFNVPYPANYGGVIDVFYKLKALSQNGFKVHLHAFKYGRAEAEELENLAYKVYYYKRNQSILAHFSKFPYIVKSREVKMLLENLEKDSFPIIFEGIHTTAYLNNPLLNNRLKLVRAHNVEHHYYENLAKSETVFWKKIFFKIESRKLKKYELILKNASAILSISSKDQEYFQNRYGNSHLLPPFHGNENVESKLGSGDYAIFHGNLSVAENYEMAEWIIENIVAKSQRQFVIAGSNPIKSLVGKARKYENLKLISNPSHAEMSKLIQEAHINLLFTNQATGIKLKLINSLYNARFCLCNSKMLEGTSVSKSVDVCELNKPSDVTLSVENLFENSFKQADLDKRKAEIDKLFKTENSVLVLQSLLHKK